MLKIPSKSRPCRESVRADPAEVQLECRIAASGGRRNGADADRGTATEAGLVMLPPRLLSILHFTFGRASLALAFLAVAVDPVDLMGFF